MTNSNLVTPRQMHRLAFVKYLLSLANHQIEQPEPLSASALLTFHDATELFLDLASEHLNIEEKSKEFIKYWDSINLKISPKKLPHKQSMKKMNTARVNLKHHGNFPSHMDLKDFAIISNNFFEESVTLIFSIEFKSISLIDLIEIDSVKGSLRKAKASLEQDNLQSGLTSCAEGFDDLVIKHENQIFGKPSFKRLYINRPPEIDDFANGVESEIEKIQFSLKVIGLGLNYRSYIRFSQLTPIVKHLYSGGRATHYPSNFSLKDIKSKDLSFCIDFIIDSALRLQEFNP